VGYGSLQVDSLTGQLAEQLLTEQDILGCNINQKLNKNYNLLLNK
jgi:hypothetical protein